MGNVHLSTTNKFFLLLLAASAGFAQQAVPPAAPADPFAMDLDSLFNTKVTTASKFAEKLSDAAGVVSVVTQDELQRFGGMTLLEVLGRVAGLNISASYSIDNSLIAVRGDQTRVDGGHVLILINGRPVREILQGGVSSDILKSFPIKILERIEVIKGPGSVLYGSDAFSGVINLITKKASGTEIFFSPAAGGSSAAAGTEEIMYTKGALQIVEAGQYHLFPVWNVDYRAAAPSNLAHDTNAVVRDDGQGLYLGANYKGFSFMSTYVDEESPTFVRGIVGDARLKKGFGDLGYALKVGSKWEMTFDATYTRSIADVPLYPSAHRDGYEGLLEWTNFITFSDRDRLTFGSLFDHIAGTELLLSTTPIFVDSHGSRNSGAFYVQHEHKLTEEWKLIGGVQVNKIGAISTNAVPRAGVIWTPSDHWTLKALYGSAFHAPSLDELLINHPGLKGDPNLIPEKVGTFDLQLTHQNNRIQSSIDFFNSRQTDLIEHYGNVIPAPYYNLGHAVTFRGAEAESKYYLQHGFFLTGSLLYQTNNSGTNVANLSPIPSVSAKAGLSYQSKNGVDISAFDGYQGHIAGYAASPNPLPGAFQSISAHLRYDLSKRWFKDSSRGVALYVHADDLTNSPIWLPALGTNQASTIPVAKGRTIFFGVELWQKKD